MKPIDPLIEKIILTSVRIYRLGWIRCSLTMVVSVQYDYVDKMIFIVEALFCQGWMVGDNDTFILLILYSGIT